MSSAEHSAVIPPNPNRIWPLALPVLAENVLLMGVNWSDTFLAGRILRDDAYLAAMTAVSYLIWFLKTAADLIAIGAFAVVAREIGAKHVFGACRVAYQAMLLAACFGIALGGFVFLRAELVAGILLPEGRPKTLAAEYLRVFAMAVPFDVSMIVAVNCMRAAGYTLAGMVIGAVVNVLNITLCWVFATGFMGLPNMGWLGLALGTTVSFVIGGILAVARLKRGVNLLKLPNQLSWPHSTTIKRIFRVGVPGAAATLSMVSCHLAFVRLVSSLGDSSVAAHGVAIQVESFSYLIGDAFAAATAALVGQSLGAGRPDLARLCGWAGVIRSAVGMGLVGIGFVMFGPMICGLFTESKQVADSAGSVVRLMGLAEAPLGAMIVLGGILRGAGDTRAMLVISLSGILGVRIPLAFWLSSESLGWGLWGMWLAMLLDVVVRFLMLGARFLGGAWMSSRV